MADFWQRLAARIGTATGGRQMLRERRPLGGGDINSAWYLQLAREAFFVKLNAASQHAMFTAESAALAELAASRSVRVPQPVCDGILDGQAYLVLEYLPLRPLTDPAAATLGGQLAALHDRPRAHFGWRCDNTIGTTPQANPLTADWIIFWREHRLGPQLRLAATHGHGGNLQRHGNRLLAQLDQLLADHHPQPALLHGDLWAGNAAMTGTGQPVIFDPASYYGDREADLAMTELFGGFPASFYAAYRESWPLDEGYPLRRDLYNLYHLLNHLNLFGGSYRAAAERLLERLLAALAG